MRKLGSLALLTGLVSLMSVVNLTNAFAARNARVSEMTELREGAGDTYRATHRLPKGTPLATSNAARDGYYKVRTQQGILGWVREDHLTFVEGAASGMGSSRRRGPSEKVRIRAIGGLDFFTASDVNTQLAFESFKGGINMGGELAFLVSPQLGITLRVEKVSKSVAATYDVNSTASNPDDDTLYNMTLSSMPIMGGVEYELTRSPNFSIQFAALVGFGSTKLESVASNLASPNTTTHSGSGIAALPKFNMNLHLARNFVFLGELGYRLLSTSKVSPTETTANGSIIFKDATGTFVPLALDMSGPVVGLGLAVYF